MRQLYRHIQVVHEGKKPFQCEFCGFTAAGKRDLVRNVLAVHEGKKKHSNTQKQGQCQEGSCSFAKNTLNAPAQFVCPSQKVWNFQIKLSLGVRCLWEGAKMKMFIWYLLTKNLIMSQNIYFVCVMHALS